MQPTISPKSDFNPLEFKKLTVEQQIAAARTMNQKDLIAAAGTAISIEELLKLQGLSDEQIQKRLAELNRYQTQLSRNNQPELHSRHEHKLTLAEFLALQEEQNHAPTQAGHKLGNIANLTHDQQVHALADHFSHGGSTSEALAALGESEAAQREQEVLEEQGRERHKEEQEKINKIRDQREKAIAQRQLDLRIQIEATALNKLLKHENQKSIIEGLEKAYSKNSELSQDASKIDAIVINQASNERQKIVTNLKNGTATEEDKNTLKKVDISERSAARMRNDLEKDKQLKLELIKDYVKDNASSANKVAAATIVAKGGISKDSISDVKDTEYKSSKAASAEALKTGTSTLKTSEWDGAEIPKPGSIKMAAWKSQKENAEAKASAPEKSNKITT